VVTATNGAGSNISIPLTNPVIPSSLKIRVLALSAVAINKPVWSGLRFRTSPSILRAVGAANIESLPVGDISVELVRLAYFYELPLGTKAN